MSGPARWGPRRDWADLPAPLVAEAERRLGAVRGFEPRRGGFSYGVLGVLTLDGGRRVFVKVPKLNLRDRLILAGPSDDVPAVMNGLDLHVLSSCAEGFPNVVAEAMACGVYCVVTDVGDAAYIVGDTGVVVPPEQAEALARGIETALCDVAARGHGRAGEAGRARVLENFDLARMVQRYIAVWRRISGVQA